MRQIVAKRLLTPQKNPGFWFDVKYNMNLYRGCVFGCIYCDSRSECYHVDDFDTIALKANYLEILDTELKGKRVRGIIGMGAMSDPYNPFEQKTLATRRALEIIHRYGFGVHLTTKSTLVQRDGDIFQAISDHSPVTVGITITTADDDLASKIEPHAPLSSQRFSAVERLAKDGVFTGIMMMPILPYINDTFDNMERIVDRAAESGARYIYPWFSVTMRTGQREFFYEGLDRHFPGLKAKYIKAYGELYECRSPRYRELYAAFEERCKRYGIVYSMEDIIKEAQDRVKWEQARFEI